MMDKMIDAALVYMLILCSVMAIVTLLSVYLDVRICKDEGE